jgi:hypothetical protein
MCIRLIKGIRKGMRELKERKFPWRAGYGYGYHDAIELCNKLIENQIRKDRRVLLKTPAYKGAVRKRYDPLGSAFSTLDLH